MLAALQLTNLLYVVAAIVVATLISSLIVLRHRRPKSVEFGIESFSRELRALAPDRDGAVGETARTTGVVVGTSRRALPREGPVAGRRPPGEHYRRVDPPRVREDGRVNGASRRPDHVNSSRESRGQGTENQAG